MKIDRVRVDLIVCMFLTVFIYKGIWYVGDKLGIGEKIWAFIGSLVSESSGLMAVMWIASALTPIVFFVIFIASVLGVHYIFARIGIFPPVLPYEERD